MDNFKIIYKILKHLETQLDCEYTDISTITHEQLGITKERWEQLLIMLIHEGYITGVIAGKRVCDSKYYIIEPIHPVITLSGLEYLYESTMMKNCQST